MTIAAPLRTARNSPPGIAPMVATRAPDVAGAGAIQPFANLVLVTLLGVVVSDESGTTATRLGGGGVMAAGLSALTQARKARQ